MGLFHTARCWWSDGHGLMMAVALSHEEFNLGREGAHYTTGWDVGLVAGEHTVKILSHCVRPGRSGPCPARWTCSKHYFTWM